MWKPSIIFLVDSEIWPNVILVAKKYQISLSLLNARITTKTFKRWMIIKSFAKKIFNTFDLCLASSNETKIYLNKLKQKYSYLGNLKLIDHIDNQLPNNPNEKVLSQKDFGLH